MAQHIEVRGARTHNLKGVDLDLQLGTLTVICGVSGSGKSSLALDTLHVEGRRRLAQTLSLRLRALLDRQPQPDLDALVGIPPTLAVRQNRGDAPGPRATVGTLSELQQLLGVLFAAHGTQHDPATGEQVRTHRADEVLAELMAEPEGTRLTVLAPTQAERRGTLAQLTEGLLTQGFARVRVNGQIHRIEDLPPVPSDPAPEIEVVVDRIRLSPDREARLADALRTALLAGQGRVLVLVDQAPRLFMEQAWVPSRSAPLPPLGPALLSFNSAAGACPICEGLGQVDGVPCAACQGQRLSSASLALRLAGHGPGEWMAWPISELGARIDALPLLPSLAAELRGRLNFLERVGLGYLHLNRSAESLSRGELQRLRLASLVSTPLRGVLYVLDEPTAGLHPQDTHKLLQILREMRDAGNTLLVVEHDPVLIAGADQVIEIGPGAGEDGGTLVFQGTPAELLEAETQTGRWMSGREQAPEPVQDGGVGELILRGATGRNLVVPELRLPLKALSVLTGPGGAGKSSVLLDTLLPALEDKPGLPYGELKGVSRIERVVLVGGGHALRSHRSNIATYSGLWTRLRSLLAATKAARIAGFEAGHFSLNQSGGRCEVCSGSGQVQVELGTLPDLSRPCPVCAGARFDQATLAVRYKGLNPAEILELSVSGARRIFSAHPRIARALKDLEEVGLGYLPIGQAGPTLSGGEVQRLRIARDLSRGQVDGTLYLLDEPASGLHPANVADLVRLLQRLVREGATVVAIAHDPVLIASAQAVFEMEEGRLL